MERCQTHLARRGLCHMRNPRAVQYRHCRTSNGNTHSNREDYGINSGNTARQEKQHSGWIPAPPALPTGAAPMPAAVPTVTAGGTRAGPASSALRPQRSRRPSPPPELPSPLARAPGSGSVRSGPVWSVPSHASPWLLCPPSVHPPWPLTRVALSAAISAGEPGSRSSFGGAALGRPGRCHAGPPAGPRRWGSPGLDRPPSPCSAPARRGSGEFLFRLSLGEQRRDPWAARRGPLARARAVSVPRVGLLRCLFAECPRQVPITYIVHLLAKKPV